MSNGRPPAAIKTKATKLDFAPLHAAYEWMAVDKPAAFRMAFDWYGLNITGLLKGDPFNPERQKSYDRALKAKALGDQAGTPEEALHAWTTALRLYETKVWPAKNLPPVEPALSAPASQRVAAVLNVLTSLNKAFAGFASYESTPAAIREYSGTAVKLPVAELHGMATQPVLKVALGEAVTVTKLASVTDGKLDGAAFMANLPKVLEAVGNWSAGAPKSAPVSGPATPRVSKPTSIKPGSDMDTALAMLRAGTPTVAEIASQTGWNNHKVTMTVSNLRKQGYNIAIRGGRYNIVP